MTKRHLFAATVAAAFLAAGASAQPMSGACQPGSNEPNLLPLSQLAQLRDYGGGPGPSHMGWGGSYRPPSHFPPPAPPAPAYQPWQGLGPSPATLAEESRTRAANRSWDSMTYVRSRLVQGSRNPSQFPGGPHGFLATVAWELGRSTNASTFRWAYGHPNRGVTLRFNYAGNSVEMYIPGDQLGQAVDALWDASSGRMGGYQFHEPQFRPPAIGAPRTAPLMLRLFGPQNGTETGLFWTALSAANTANPNRNLSPHSGWIGAQPPGR